MYPDVLNHRSEAREILLDKLLKALALQLGNEVSYNELSNLLQMDKFTVAKYIDFIEEANGKITAFEFKWKSKPSSKIPISFIREYNANGHIIDVENFRTFVRK